MSEVSIGLELKVMIEGVQKIPLKILKNENGELLHFMRNDSSSFHKFGEVYFSITYPGAIKGWKLHKRMEQNFVVPVGQMKVVLFDDRENSNTFGECNEFLLGKDDYFLLKIPDHIWYSFSPIGSEASMIANCSSIPHDPDESIFEELTSSRFPYQWN